MRDLEKIEHDFHNAQAPAPKAPRVLKSGKRRIGRGDLRLYGFRSQLAETGAHDDDDRLIQCGAKRRRGDGPSQKELQAECERLGLAKSGNKAVLTARIASHKKRSAPAGVAIGGGVAIGLGEEADQTDSSEDSAGEEVPGVIDLSSSESDDSSGLVEVIMPSRVAPPVHALDSRTEASAVDAAQPRPPPQASAVDAVGAAQPRPPPQASAVDAVGAAQPQPLPPAVQKAPQAGIRQPVDRTLLVLKSEKNAVYYWELYQTEPEVKAAASALKRFVQECAASEATARFKCDYPRADHWKAVLEDAQAAAATGNKLQYHVLYFDDE